MTFRTFRVIFFLVGYLIRTAPERRRLHKLEKTDPQAAGRQSFLNVQKAFGRICQLAGIEIRAEGLENIPEEACLFVGNHCSYFDVVTTGSILPCSTGYVAKDSLGRIPGLSDWMSLIHCLFLDRSDIKEGLKTILQGADYIKDGYSMFIFPEGTRHEEGAPGEFKGGSLKMAQRAKAPIVPVAISGSRSIYEDNKGLRIKPGIVYIRFGTPFLFSDLSKEEKRFAADYTRQRVLDMLEGQKTFARLEGEQEE